MKLTSLLGGYLPFSVVAAAALPSVLSAQTFSAHYELVNVNSGIVCEVKSASTASGAAVDQYVASNGSHQHWTITTISTGVYKIQNINSGLVLEVPGASTTPAAACDQASYTGGTHQQWKIVSVGNGQYTLTNVHSGQLLEVRGASTSDGGVVDQYTANGGANQKWYLLATGVPSGTVTPSSGGSGAAASTFHGFNWACTSDNFQDNFLFLSGMSSGQSYSSIQSLTTMVVNGFKSAGANALRIPINPATAIGSWWGHYKAVIDEATALGTKVIVCNWGRAGGNGTVPDQASYYLMWDTVVNAYNGNPNVYFELYNEPFGYSTASAWLAEVQNWLNRYPTVPRGRVFVGGTGYCQNVPAVASSSITSGCLFSCHDYGFFHKTETTNSWFYSNLSSSVGSYSSRTVLTEFGAQMTTGLNYQGGDQGSYFIASMIGFCDYCHDHNMGSIYWPGVRDGDTYSMYTRNGSTSLTLNNQSGLTLVKYGWGAATGGN